jgi:hypothetical protein
MSTTLQTISNNLVALGLNNISNASLYGKISEALAQTVDDTITEMSNTKQTILDIINNQRYGKSGYYTDTAKAFQYGDNLIVDPVTLNDVYAVIDPTKQIVTQAAFESVSGQLFLKIATTDALGNLTVLSGAQLLDFTSYFLNFEIPGLPVSIVSIPGNVLDFVTKCTYYPTYNLSTLQANVAAALDTFKKTFQFNGVLYNGDIESYMRSNVPGIRDFYVGSTTIDGNPYTGSTTLYSGYFNYTATILSQITYQSA